METETSKEISFKTTALTPEGQIKTMDDLVREAEIDLDVWFVSRAVMNKWDSTGKGPDNTPYIIPLYQVKLFLERAQPVFTLHPASGPPLPSVETVIQSRIGGREPGIESVLFLPDFQIGYVWNESYTYLNPFHDREAIDVAYQLAYDLQPNHIVVLGDFLDLPVYSKFDQSSHHLYQNTTQAAIEEGYRYLRMLRDLCPRARIQFIMGNHDVRLERCLARFKSEVPTLRAAQDLKPALSIRNLLRFDELRIDTNDDYDMPVWLWDRVKIRHGEESANLNAQKLTHTTIQGHAHGIVYDVKTVATPVGRRVVSMMSPGCLCKIDGTVPSGSKNVDWQQGVGIGFYDTRQGATGQEHLAVIPIHEGKMWYGNKTYNAENPDTLAMQASLATGVMQFRPLTT